MKVGEKEFDWLAYQEIMENYLYKKYTNSKDSIVSFSPSNICVNFFIPSKKNDDFKKWLIKERIATSVEEEGKNRFIIHLTNSFIDKFSKKEISKLWSDNHDK